MAAKSRVADRGPAKMLRDRSTSASGKLHRSVGVGGQWQQWAVHVCQIETIWLDCGDTANGRNEPKPDLTNSCCVRSQRPLCCNSEGYGVRSAE
ncbi:MAG: hypothetical protein P8Q99_11660 [Paracoccaceae bacterium]|nr:hypothetical protein [Paracoccaceae bacterium]